MEMMEQYTRWCKAAKLDADLLAELLSIQGNEAEIAERFGASLAFGTAGLRGVLGAGPNRMNVYTVAKATKGLGGWLLADSKAPKSVAIAYDSRNKSELFAHTAARVLAGLGITAWLYDTLMPTPALSFAVRHLGCGAGIMVTASHNPAKYNGYKVYGPDGCQLTEEGANAILSIMAGLDYFPEKSSPSEEEARQAGLVKTIPPEVTRAFYDAVKAMSVRPALFAETDLQLVFTPLNGTGNIPVRTVLAEMGFSHITVVPQQELPDGNFPTAPYPNPELPEAMRLGLALAAETGADLLLATDPDADRVGVGVRDKEGQLQQLTGNEIGVLLTDYLAQGRAEKGILPKGSLLVRSLVSTSLADKVAAQHGIETRVVLTGFKYIGEQILQLEQKGEENKFFFGFEESSGYLPGSYVRDKDAVAASLLLVEMAAYHKAQGRTLLDRLSEIYEKHGFYLTKVDSFAYEGLAGAAKMKEMMASLRQNPPTTIGAASVQQVLDYQRPQPVAGGQPLPLADILVYKLEGEQEVIVRPSGTEPKIKVYYTVPAKTQQAAAGQQQALAAAMAQMLGA